MEKNQNLSSMPQCFESTWEGIFQGPAALGQKQNCQLAKKYKHFYM